MDNLCSHIANANKDHKDGYEHLVYVFQGGGALGAFQFGAYQALCQAGYRPSWICGISIGSINSSIIAGNPPDKVMAKLSAFWNKVSFPCVPPEISRLFSMPKLVHDFYANMALMVGIPNFCRPMLLNPWLIQSNSVDRISFYSVEPLKALLESLIDFDYLNQAHTRLSLGAVDIREGQLVYFDNTKQTLDIRHVLASCALPPGFPAVKIGTRYYWDAGIYSNSPLNLVLSEVSEANTLCFMVDNFSGQGPLPHTLDGVLEREKDIRYSSHSKRQTQLHTTQHNLRNAIAKLGDLLSSEQRKDPKVRELLQLGSVGHLHIGHIIYKSPTGTELHSKDYDFSENTIQRRIVDGFNHTCNLLENGRESWLEQIQDNDYSIVTQEEEQLFAHLH